MRYLPGRQTSQHSRLIDRFPVTKESSQACPMGPVTFLSAKQQHHHRQPLSLAWWVTGQSVTLRGINMPPRQAGRQDSGVTGRHAVIIRVKKTATAPQPASPPACQSQPSSRQSSSSQGALRRLNPACQSSVTQPVNCLAI